MNLWKKYKYLQDIVLLIIFQFRLAHFAFLHSSCLQLDWDVYWKLFWVSVPVSEIFGYDVRFFSSTVMLVMTWSLSVSWMGWSPPYTIQWTNFDKSLKLEIHTPRFQSHVRCDGVHGDGEHETPVRDLWRPIERETLRRLRLRGLQGFLQAEKTVNQNNWRMFDVDKKDFIQIIVLIIFSGGRSERVLVQSTSAKGTVSVR